MLLLEGEPPGEAPRGSEPGRPADEYEVLQLEGSLREKYLEVQNMVDPSTIDEEVMLAELAKKADLAEMLAEFGKFADSAEMLTKLAENADLAEMLADLLQNAELAEMVAELAKNGRLGGHARRARE